MAQATLVLLDVLYIDLFRKQHSIGSVGSSMKLGSMCLKLHVLVLNILMIIVVLGGSSNTLVFMMSSGHKIFLIMIFHMGRF
jgi:hypothetical protein